MNLLEKSLYCFVGLGSVMLGVLIYKMSSHAFLNSKIAHLPTAVIKNLTATVEPDHFAQEVETKTARQNFSSHKEIPNRSSDQFFQTTRMTLSELQQVNVHRLKRPSDLFAIGPAIHRMQRKIMVIAKISQRQKELQPIAQNFMKSCAESEATFPAMRVLCYKHWQTIGDNSTRGTEPQIPDKMRKAAQRLIVSQ